MWQLMKGYVIIQIKGKDAERLLNAIRAHGISMADIRRIDRHTVHCRLRAADFKHLHRIARKSRCRIHILSRGGTVFRVRRILRQKTLLISLAVVFSLILFFSTRICFIRVVGCERIAEKTVLRALESLGVSVGRPRKGLSFPELNTQLLAADERIAWAGLSLDGVILTVEIEEAVLVPDAINPDIPCDIVAVKDGVIVSVTAHGGVPAVKTGDIVHAGDVLIRGDLTREDSQSPLFVHAYGEAIAEVYYFSQAAVLSEVLEPQPSGRTEPYRAVQLGGRAFYESKTSFAAYEKANVACENLFGCCIPLTLLSGEYAELTEQSVMLDESEMRSRAAAEAEQNAMLRIPKDAKIIEKSVIYAEHDGCLIAVACIVTHESIGLKKEISYDGNE